MELARAFQRTRGDGRGALYGGQTRDLGNEVVRRVSTHFEDLPANLYNDLQPGLEPLL